MAVSASRKGEEERRDQMKFKEAKDELKKMAKGKYHSIQYQLVEYASGILECECYLYVDPNTSVTTSNWKDSLYKMRMILEPSQKVELSEMPGEELNDGRKDATV
jgi:hypothetical protein